MFTRRFLVSLAIEFGPITLFFIASELGTFFIGTALLNASTIAATAVSLVRDRRLPLFSLLSSFFVLLFGGLTLIFWEPRFLVIEYSLYNAIAGVVMLSGLLFGKPFLKPLFETMFLISDRGWRILSFRWGLMFIATAIGNEIVWTTYGEEGWVIFRFVAAVVLCIFGFLQITVSRRERLPGSNEWGLRL